MTTLEKVKILSPHWIKRCGEPVNDNRLQVKLIDILPKYWTNYYGDEE